MNRIMVKTAGRPFPCEITGRGECKYCARPVIWARTANRKAIPLEPFGDTAVFAEAHFQYCGRLSGGRASSRLRRRLRGVEMSLHIWRLLVQLTHPDRHADNEVMANEAVRWLIEQRSRLVQGEDK